MKTTVIERLVQVIIIAAILLVLFVAVGRADEDTYVCDYAYYSPAHVGKAGHYHAAWWAFHYSGEWYEGVFYPLDEWEFFSQ